MSAATPFASSFEASKTRLHRTQAFNLTSNIIVKIGPNATILGTSEDRYNLEKDGGDWPVLPWPEYPSLPTRSPSPAAQAVVRGYNLTNVSIVAEPGGMLDCGGTYWICQAWGGEHDRLQTISLAGIVFRSDQWRACVTDPTKAHGFCGGK